jgi:hypothetical protein
MLGIIAAWFIFGKIFGPVFVFAIRLLFWGAF